jgi:hypothetical protein
MSNLVLGPIALFEFVLLIFGLTDKENELLLGLSELVGQMGTMSRMTVVEKRWGMTSYLSFTSASFAIGRLGMSVVSHKCKSPV